MEHASTPIVQAEFFLTDMSKEYGHAMTMLNQRMIAGHALKACVRFFDTRGLVTKAVLQARFADARSKTALDMLSLSETPEHHHEYGSMYQSTREEFSVRKNDLRRCVIRELRFTVDKKLAMAIEQNDHSYRPMLENECAQFMKDITGASDLWVFLFTPGNLLSDTHKHMISVM